MTKTGGIGISGNRLLAIAFALMATLTLNAIGSKNTAASFTSLSMNPVNVATTLVVQPPASQSNTTSAAAGVVSLAWTATTTAPGAGHTLTYDVLRGPVGGPYSVVGNTASLTFNDTPPADGSYGYVVHAKVTGGGTFTSTDSPAKSGLSDRTAPAMSVTCNAVACNGGWYTAAVSVTVSGADGGTGMGSVTRNVDAAGQASTAGATVTFNVTGDSTGHTVQYFGTDAAGNAASPASQTIKIDATAPTAAAALASLTGTSVGSVDLSWTAATDATSGIAGYTVHYVQATACPATANPASFPSTFAIAGNVSAGTVTGLTTAKKYCFYLSANDNAGNAGPASGITGPTKAQ